MNLHPLPAATKRPILASEFPRLGFTFLPSSDGVDEHLLVLFHGLGDLHSNFARFGQRMNLPQTAVLSLGGPCLIPGMEQSEGSGWFPAFDLYGNDIPPNIQFAVNGMLKTREIVVEFLEHCVFVPGRWKGSPSKVFLFGFSQGGCAAIDIAMALSAKMPQFVVGGVISIAGWIEPGMGADLKSNATDLDLLIVQGNKDDIVPYSGHEGKHKHLQSLLNDPKNCELVVIDGKDHCLPGKDRVEMLRVMTFLSTRMTLRNIKMEDMNDVFEVK
ncbi:Alpha/Beta hydrolase protein [Chytriomyces sp. MP71]|nr:Alpha/Beta hydrolase protein [Chytriomyces sp. MP71]